MNGQTVVASVSFVFLHASIPMACKLIASPFQQHKCQGLGGGLTAGEVIIQVLPAGEEAEKEGTDWSTGERDGRDVCERSLASREALFTTKSGRVTAIGLDITT